jgi:spermidine/putrescine transport system permease protein
MNKLTLKEILSSIPSLVWLFVFFLAPTCIIFIYSFKPSGLYGGIESGWTLKTLQSLANPYFFILLFRTLWISTLTTLICLFLALPMGYQIATSKSRWRHLMLMMIVIPFWSSFLIRIFAWKTILHPEGFLHLFLETIGILSPNTPLLYTNFAVIVVMIYTLLPFALLPIYTSASKFNFQLIEAAMDLGATRFMAFAKVFVPSIKKGITTAAFMVFIPAFGTYVIPDLVGGINSDMIGNKIAQKTFAERNLPEASAISLVLCLIILIPLGLMAAYAKRSKSFLAKSRNRE